MQGCILKLKTLEVEYNINEEEFPDKKEKPQIIEVNDGIEGPVANMELPVEKNFDQIKKDILHFIG